MRDKNSMINGTRPDDKRNVGWKYVTDWAWVTLFVLDV